MQKRIAIYPGTFDPITNGHLDVLNRACALFDEVVMLVASNVSKNPLFTLDERIDLINKSIDEGKNIIVQGAEKRLTVDVAREMGASAIIRGLRAVSDFEYEFQMAQMNRRLDDEIETVFFMPSEHYFYTSSMLIRQVAGFETERISDLVSEPVLKALEAKLQK